jgi:multiple sugar transport system substrate-binding protein
VASFADRRGLTALDPYMQRDGISRDHWIKVYADLCTHNGTMWAVPTTPTTIALHWNKAMFEEAGLDPERPPRTLEELDDYAERLTRYDNDGNIVQMGFLPQEPDWYTWAYGPWFGATLLAAGEVTANHPQNIEALAWMQKYSLKYGVDRIKRFASGFGNFSSPQNAFFSRKVAMGFHGVWLHNYMTQYAPGMRYGVAAFPKTPHGPVDFCVADADVLVIPAGVPAQRREAAWEFVKFVSSQRGMELLCMGQRKNTPLAQVSEEFLAAHPHPFIRQLIELSRSPGAVHLPQVGIWVRYEGELRAAAERVRLLDRNPKTGRPVTPREILNRVQIEMTRAHERHLLSLSRHAGAEVRR